MKTRWIVSLLIVLGLTAAVPALSRAADEKKEDKKEKKEEHEKKVDIAKVPAAVKATIEKEVGDAKISEVLEGSDTEGGKPTYYEAKYMKDGKKLEVKVDPAGKVISKGESDD